MDQNDYLISGDKTKNDWNEFDKKLLIGSTDAWKKAIDTFFKPRLNLRYLNPIKILQENGTFQGEGFSIMTILCSLIEFLESTCQGKIYKYLKKGETLGINEYSSSKNMFKEFLINRKPFCSVFNVDIADDFYSNIRCGLLHEASTKNGWRIHADSTNANIIDYRNKIVFRDHFEKAIHEFITNYENELLISPEFQNNFKTKWASL